MSAGFEEMRASLVARGFLTADYRLTEAGNDHVAALIEQLGLTEAPCDPAGRRVVWNTKGRGLPPLVTA